MKMDIDEQADPLNIPSTIKAIGYNEDIQSKGTVMVTCMTRIIATIKKLYTN
jgi:hypothetical protein